MKHEVRRTVGATLVRDVNFAGVIFILTMYWRSMRLKMSWIWQGKQMYRQKILRMNKSSNPERCDWGSVGRQWSGVVRLPHTWRSGHDRGGTRTAWCGGKRGVGADGHAINVLDETLFMILVNEHGIHHITNPSHYESNMKSMSDPYMREKKIVSQRCLYCYSPYDAMFFRVYCSVILTLCGISIGLHGQVWPSKSR